MACPASGTWLQVTLRLYPKCPAGITNEYQVTWKASPGAKGVPSTLRIKKMTNACLPILAGLFPLKCVHNLCNNQSTFAVQLHSLHKNDRLPQGFNIVCRNRQSNHLNYLEWNLRLTNAEQSIDSDLRVHILEVSQCVAQYRTFGIEYTSLVYGLPR